MAKVVHHSRSDRSQREGCSSVGQRGRVARALASGCQAPAQSLTGPHYLDGSSPCSLHSSGWQSRTSWWAGSVHGFRVIYLVMRRGALGMKWRFFCMMTMEIWEWARGQSMFQYPLHTCMKQSMQDSRKYPILYSNPFYFTVHDWNEEWGNPTLRGQEKIYWMLTTNYSFFKGGMFANCLVKTFYITRWWHLPAIVDFGSFGRQWILEHSWQCVFVQWGGVVYLRGGG